MEQRADISYMLFLAVTAAVGGLLFGYDTAVISGTVELVTARFGLDSLQQGWYVGCALAGSIAGVLCAGVLSDRLGRRRTMLVSAVLFTVSAVGCALCADFTQLVVYRIVGGLGIGVVSIVSPLYISEVSAAGRPRSGGSFCRKASGRRCLSARRSPFSDSSWASMPYFTTGRRFSSGPDGRAATRCSPRYWSERSIC